MDSENTILQFNGKLKLIDGQCEIILYTPVADTNYIDNDTIIIPQIIFNEIYTAPADIKFDETFDAIEGDWRFYYKLSMYEKIEPFGNLNFVFKYEK